MIKSIKHKGLRRLYEDSDQRMLSPDMVERIQRILSALEEARVVGDMDHPTFKLHALKGDRKGFWAVTVRANWRIIFRIANGNAIDVDFVDYH